MSACCVSGCSNRSTVNGKLRFYSIPSACRPFNADRRRLWLQAIQQVNGSTENLQGNVQICGAHFISGEPSRDFSNPDFVPSVFNHTKQNAKRKAKWYMGRRKRKRFGAKDKTEDTTIQPEAGSPSDLQSAEELEPLSPEPLSTEPKEEETLTSDAEAETKAVTPQTPLSPNKALPSLEASAGILEQDKKFPVVLLKQVFTPAQGYRCQVCVEKFPTVSQLLKHEQLHRGTTQDGESCEEPFTRQADFHENQQVQEPSFPCNICDRSFTSTHHLKRHKLLHVKDGRKCNICGVLFCQRHNHVLYLPQTETVDESVEDSSVEDSSIIEPESQESDQITDPHDNTQSTLTLTLPATSPLNSPSLPKYSRPLSKTRNPLPPPSHTNVMKEIPLPVFKKPSCQPRGPKTQTDLHLLPYRFSTLSQPQFFQDIELPPSLQMFSPKLLTSPFFEVTRNYDYIFSKQKAVEKIIKDENWEVPLIEEQSIKPDEEDILPYIDVVF